LRKKFYKNLLREGRQVLRAEKIVNHSILTFVE